MRLLSWLIGLPVAAVAVLFAASNKEIIAFALWPLPMTLSLPLYLAMLGTLVAGFLVGGIVAWMGQGRARSRARRLADKVFSLERDVKTLQERAAAAEKALAENTRPVSGEPRGNAGKPALPTLSTAA